MKFNFRRWPIAFFALTLLLGGALAQTRTTTRTVNTNRARPTVKTNSQASYRYAWEHGYRAGYEDGYVKGKSDLNEAKQRDAQDSEAYRRADRGYEQKLGSFKEYQDGYQIGFELGYDDGYFGRGYTVAIPANLARAIGISVGSNTVATTAPPATTNRPRQTEPNETRTTNERQTSAERDRRERLLVRDGVQMKIRLQTPISTKTNAEGDKFTAVVLDPSEYADAVVTGHIAKLSKSGRVQGKTEISLVFDTIELRDGSRSRFAAQIERIYESEKVKTVDEEGNVESSSRTKETVVRTGGGAALGAIIGGIAGGGKGAAIGAAIGAGVGAGSLILQGGKELQLDAGAEMLIRSAAPGK
jgi:hypothetical protein